MSAPLWSAYRGYRALPYAALIMEYLQYNNRQCLIETNIKGTSSIPDGIFGILYYIIFLLYQTDMDTWLVLVSYLLVLTAWVIIKQRDMKNLMT